MSKTPWILTRDMFLDERELDGLLGELAREVAAARGVERDEALLNHVVVASLALSGLRNSEFCHLKLDHVDLEIRRPAFQVAGTRSEDRRVFVPRALRKLLRDYAGTARLRALPADVSAKDPEQPFFFNDRQRPFDRTTLYRRVVKILAAHGLESRASVQLLRHTYGYIAYLRTGGNLLFVQRQLGHAHPMVTAIYEQFFKEDYAALADKVGSGPDALRPSPPTSES